MRRFPSSAALLFVAVALSCSSEPAPSPPGAVAMFSVGADLAETKFFDHPFPSDLRRDANGKAVFTGFPNPQLIPLVGQYIDATKGLFDGFSPAAAIYLRFTGPIDESALPADPPATLATDAPVQIVNVDPASPERGKRALATIKLRTEEGVYWQPNTLAVMPMLGRPLRPKTRYACVVTRRVGAVPAPELEEVLGFREATPATEKVRGLYAPAVTELAAAGIAAADIAHLAVFTTNDPTEETFAVADDVKANVPVPQVKSWTQKETNATLDVYEGIYGPSPNYQAGEIPFRKPENGGSFLFENGKPKVQGTFDPRFALAVPNAAACPPPAGGYPIVLYEHGTGGDYRSFVDDGTAASLAQQCLASMGVDQIFHGTRPGAPPENDPNAESVIQLLFFNLDNAYAARTNNRQSAIDVVQRLRLFTDAQTKVPAASSRTGADIAFDATRVLFFGHSQGGLNGPLFLAATDKVRGAVFSGAGSIISLALIEKTKPVDIPRFVRLLLGLSDERGAELDVFHPAMMLAQSIVDAVDPIHYGRFITSEPRAGFPPKSVVMTEGVASDGSGDTYSPPRGIEALSLSIGLPRIAPGTKPMQESQWAGLRDVTLPTSGNLAGGRATGGLAQYAPPAGSDGHFVVFRVPAARALTSKFLKELSADPVGRLAN